MTASMVKGATAGNLLADAIKKAIEFAKEWTIEAAKEAAHTERAAAIARSLAKAHGDGAAAAQKAIEAIREVGYTAADATNSRPEAHHRGYRSGQGQEPRQDREGRFCRKHRRRRRCGGVREDHAGDRDGPVRGLRTLNLFPDLAKAEQVATLQAQLHGKTLSELEIKQVRYNAIVEAATRSRGPRRRRRARSTAR